MPCFLGSSMSRAALVPSVLNPSLDFVPAVSYHSCHLPLSLSGSRSRCDWCQVRCSEQRSQDGDW